MTMHIANLPNRSVLHVFGDDAAEFLQGLITNDVEQVAEGNAVFSALLTPQGKFLHDFFVVAAADGFWLETDAAGAETLKKRLSRYRLRSKVTLEIVPAKVWALWSADGHEIEQPGLVYQDPRHAEIGWRGITHDTEFEATASEAEYDLMRLGLGIPDGALDLVAESSALLESNYDALNAIAWDKGCYMGQELTARTRYRGLVKRRLASIRFDGDTIPFQTPVTHGERVVGEVRSTRGGVGLASIRLDAMGLELKAEGVELQATLPEYLENLEE